MLFLFERIKDTKQDLKNLFDLKSESNDVYWSGYTAPPEKLVFADWFKKQLDRDDRMIWLVREMNDSQSAIGYLYITFEKFQFKKIAQIGYGATEKLKGMGIGSAIVNFSVNVFINDFIKADEIHAWVLKENIASAKSLYKNKFKKLEETQDQFFSSMERNVLLEKFVFSKDDL
jgi:RimJ/RimL family protein N-acetyltransferase